MWLGYTRMSVCHYFYQCLGLGELVNWSEWCSLHTSSTVFPQGKAPQLRSFTCVTELTTDSSLHILYVLHISASWPIMLPVLTEKYMVNYKNYQCFSYRGMWET